MTTSLLTSLPEELLAKVYALMEDAQDRQAMQKCCKPVRRTVMHYPRRLWIGPKANVVAPSMHLLSILREAGAGITELHYHEEGCGDSLLQILLMLLPNLRRLIVHQHGYTTMKRRKCILSCMRTRPIQLRHKEDEEGVLVLPESLEYLECSDTCALHSQTAWGGNVDTDPISVTLPGQLRELRCPGCCLFSMLSSCDDGNSTIKRVMTLDNGGVAFVVTLLPGHSNVFWRDLQRGREHGGSGAGRALVHAIRRESLYPKDIRITLWREFTYAEAFVGLDSGELNDPRRGLWFDGGNSVLLNTAPDVGEYVFVGEDVFSFRVEPGDKIMRYVSDVGNSGVPYPYAVGYRRVYLMVASSGWVPSSVPLQNMTSGSNGIGTGAMPRDPYEWMWHDGPNKERQPLAEQRQHDIRKLLQYKMLHPRM